MERYFASTNTVATFAAASAPELVALAARNCRLKDYQEIDVPSFKVPGEFVAYSSPDSTYAVTKARLAAARTSILIGIYDFTAGYVKELLLQAMQRGVKVTLMLDLDGRTGETEIFEDLEELGCEAVPAPSCGSDRARFFASAHEKVIVIDDTWTLVQSGNYSHNSIPLNEVDGGNPDDFVPGNRDMGLAIRSKPLARFFTRVLRSDIQLELTGAAGPGPLSPFATQEPLGLLQAAPSQPPTKLFPSRRFDPPAAVSVTPVLSPDNYLAVVRPFLASARQSIFIEQQYIRGQQPAVAQLLGAIRAAMDRRPALDVRIVLAKPFPGDDFEREAQRIRDLGTQFGLKLGTHVRILNPKHFVHCHNKLIIVDEAAVLVGSQNWSDSALEKNREASLLVRFPELARYYATIFASDWETGLKTLRQPTAAPFFQPRAFAEGKLVPLNLGDYEEV